MISILYGGIVSVALVNLESRIHDIESRSQWCLHALVALGVFTFGFYVLAGYVIVVREFRYEVSGLSSARYLLDLVMAFSMMAIILPSVRMSDTKSVLEVLAAATIFHSCAVAWIFLAFAEHRESLPTLDQTGPHLFFMSAYWLGAIMTRITLKLLHKRYDASHAAYFVTQSVLMLVFGLYRSAQMVSAFDLPRLGQ